MKDLFFEVQKVPISDIGINLTPKRGISEAIVAPGLKRILAFVSPDYSLLPNRTLYEVFERGLKERLGKFEFNYSTWDYSRFRMSFVFPQHKTDVKVGDAVAPEIRLFNSYDGRVKYSFKAGIQRLVCANGLTLLENESSIQTLHTGDIISSVEDSLEAFEEVLKNWDLYLEDYKDLASYKVNPQLRVEEVVEETKFPNHLREIAETYLQQEMKEVPAITDWEIYQAFNYALVHEAPQLLGRKSEAIDREVMTYLLNS